MKRKSILDVLCFDGNKDWPAPKPSKRRLTIMSALATGWLPWGIEWHPSLPLANDYGKDMRPIRYEFPLCCGHVMKPAEAQQFVDAGLLTLGTSRHGEDALVITETGKAWLAQNW
jgi:hypothetical protein